MTERKLITTPQINEQLNVSAPQRAVIVHCSLIEGAKGGRMLDPEKSVEEEVVPYFDSADTSQQEKTTIIPLKLPSL